MLKLECLGKITCLKKQNPNKQKPHKTQTNKNTTKPQQTKTTALDLQSCKCCDTTFWGDGISHVR